MSKNIKQNTQVILSQREIGLKLQKMIKNDKKCFQFTKYLSKAVLGHQIQRSSEIKQKNKFINLNHSEVFVITSSKQFNLKMKQKKNIINTSKLLHSKLQSLSVLSEQFNSNQNDQNNQFLRQSTIDKSQNVINKDNAYLDSSRIFKDIQLENKLQYKLQNNKYQSKASSQSLQVEEQYFQIQIQISGSQTYTHYVKINTQVQYNSKLSHNSQGQSYNLSNFSSFNGGSMQTNQNKIANTSFQDQFYQQQLMYLVKSIQTKFSKKITDKGIQKLTQQLHDLLHMKKQVKMSKDTKNLALINKNKNITTLQVKNEKINSNISLNNKSRSNFTKKPNKQFMEHSISCLKAEQQINSKMLCIKNIQPCIKNIQPCKNRQPCIKSRQPCVKNKQSCIKNKQNIWIQQIAPVTKSTSSSQLSYRVMMQKKNQPKQKAISPVHKSIINSQVSKPCLLKILIQQDEKIRTLYFQYQNGKHIGRKKQIQEYCAKNKVNHKNQNIIRQAIQHNKSIVTLKHF